MLKEGQLKKAQLGGQPRRRRHGHEDVDAAGLRAPGRAGRGSVATEGEGGTREGKDTHNCRGRSKEGDGRQEWEKTEASTEEEPYKTKKKGKRKTFFV